MYTEKKVGDRSHNDHGNSASREISRVTRKNRDKLKPGEPIDIIGTGSNYEESDLISAPDNMVERLRKEHNR
ncbi:MAG TPA: hypothetical protein VF145_11185 [Chitinophagaceae bacterium]